MNFRFLNDGPTGKIVVLSWTNERGRFGRGRWVILDELFLKNAWDACGVPLDSIPVPFSPLIPSV